MPSKPKKMHQRFHRKKLLIGFSLGAFIFFGFFLYYQTKLRLTSAFDIVVDKTRPEISLSGTEPKIYDPSYPSKKSSKKFQKV